MSVPQDRRVWLAGGIATSVILAAASWFMFISPTLSNTSSLQGQRVAVQQQNATLSDKIAQLKVQNDNLDSLRQNLATALNGLPPDSGLSDFTREVSVVAAAAGVSVAGISVGTVAPHSATGVTGGNAPASTGSPAGKLYSIAVTISSSGPERNQFEFLRLLQHVGARRVLINSTQFGPGSGAVVASLDPSSNLTTVLSVFSAPVTPTQETQLEKLLSSTGS